MHTVNPEPVIIPLNKYKLVWLLLAALGFVALGIWFVASPATFGQSAFKQGMVMVVGVVCILLFGTCAVFIARKLPDTRPGIIIAPEGITDNASGVAGGFIPWQDITELRTVEVNKQRFIMVMVQQPGLYLDRAPNAFKRKMMQLNYKMYGSPISISASGLKCSYNELHTLMVNHWNDALQADEDSSRKTPHPNPPQREGL